MRYREDEDLEFLKTCTSEDLNTLVEILITDKDGNTRLTQELTSEERYQDNEPDHNKYWDLIATEIQCFGANTFATLLRGGEGILYREILGDVCDKMNVNYNPKSSVETIEMNLLMKILIDSMEDMTTEQLKQIVEDLDLNTTDFKMHTVIAALQTGIKFSGFIGYKVAVIVANAVAKAIIGRGLTVAMNAGLTRTIAFCAGPIGWILTGLWTALDVAGPAYRVTIPCVIQIAFLRAKMKFEQKQTLQPLSNSSEKKLCRAIIHNKSQIR